MKIYLLRTKQLEMFLFCKKNKGWNTIAKKCLRIAKSLEAKKLIELKTYENKNSLPQIKYFDY